MRQQLTFTISRDFSMAINIASSSFSAWYFLHQLFVSCPLTASAYDFEEESIFSNRAKTLLYLQYGKAQISILSVSQRKELITDTGNHDQVFLATPLGLFSNFPGPLPITSAREILLSGGWTCEESFLDSWITPHVYKDSALFLRFFCHISSLRDVTVTREI